MASVSPVAYTVGCSNVLGLLMVLVGAAALSTVSASLVLLLRSRSPLPAPLGLGLVCWLWLLMARVELIANAAVLHARASDVREPVVVPLDFQRVGDDRLHPVVVAHDLNLVDDSEGRVS